MWPQCWMIKDGFNTPLLGVLHGIKTGAWATEVERVRRCEVGSTGYEASKALLPAFTACGTFQPNTRLLTTLEEFSGVVAMDFDLKDNPDLLSQRAALEHDPFTWACILSCGGRGLFVLLRLAVHPGHHEWFDDLREYYILRYNLRADRACRDITRLRFVSHDPDLYMNKEAQLFLPAPLLGEAPRIVAPTKLLPGTALHPDGIDSSFDLEETVRLIEQHRLDLTSPYEQWVGLAAALATSLGEVGRAYFHRISVFHPQYKAGQTDRKFDSFLNKPSKVGLGKLYSLLREQGYEPVRRAKTFSST
jgi:hypothetical protein